MGARGPRPRPTKLKLLYGETRPCRVNQNEPTPPPTKLNPARCPSHLTPDAKKVWRQLAPQLAQRGLLTEWDRISFEVFCEYVPVWRRARQMLEHAVLIKGRHGSLVRNPASAVSRDAALLLRSFAQEFGLTPSARSGIALPNEDDGELARLLS